MKHIFLYASVAGVFAFFLWGLWFSYSNFDYVEHRPISQCDYLEDFLLGDPRQSCRSIWR